ncbi:LOW QUALITY PROTEIN: testis-expressed protein 19-like [Zalophus californianus]|uniref:LOW QUALITY PROTEIN: testis-expressed protein 19-like n=1 Tax=Zalophus californianus TaxID=9704 RepID=A0A6P9EZR5_ZALCA|nr:LOW QUALITY PROTEIN: testis-expressed protein 19-like [Zalophus californianus]
MCPPVSARYGGEGMSYLHASWVYQLRHGGRLGVCFACFRAAFLELRDLLGLEDWEDEDWDPELLDHGEAGPEQGASPGMGLGGGQGPGHPAQGATVDWGPGTAASAPAASEEVGPDPPLVPTELEPQDAAPLGLGPEDADWTQSLPWRLGGPPTCAHWPSLPPAGQGLPKVDLPPGEPMVLELRSTGAGDPAEAEAWLRGLQVISVAGGYDAVYLRKMTVGRALRTPGQGWTLLLEPDEVVRLQDAPQEQWQLRVLECLPPGQSGELVPAASALLRRGFSILSYSPWATSEAGEGACASGPQPSSSRGQGSQHP